MWTKHGLVEFIESKLKGYRFILVSNREPYIHRHVGDAIECEQPASGLVVALEPVMRASGGVWIAHGNGDADREAVDAHDHVMVPPEAPSFTLRRVWLNRRQETRYYYGLSNRGLWPLCHVAFTRPAFEPEDWEAYREVNALFADVVLEEAGNEPTFVFIQDFHFGLLPRMLKDRNPNLIVAQFWHIPWPNPEIFQGFPWKNELIDGMLGSDLLGFHLRLHCQNFMDTVDCTLEARVDQERFEIVRNSKSTTVRPFPISIDFDRHALESRDSRTTDCVTSWRRSIGLHDEQVGIGIDRIDYTKGIPERFRALDRLLTLYPEYRGRLVFIQIAVPSRSRIREYRALEEEIHALAEEINWKWASGSWRPLVCLKNYYPQSQLIGLHRLADFCVVSSLHDGMNLVAKEYVASRSDEDGVLILSEFAGASRELTDALIVNPFNAEELTEAMKTALTMPQEERWRRMQRMRAAVEQNNIYRWTGKIVSALLRLDVSGVNFHDSTLAERSPC